MSMKYIIYFSFIQKVGFIEFDELVLATFFVGHSLIERSTDGKIVKS